MKVWGAADPRLLSRQHLLGEHSEIHQIRACLVEGKYERWRTHPEVRRFENQLDLLWFRHELVRVVMHERWDRHGIDEHPTPWLGPEISRVLLKALVRAHNERIIPWEAIVRRAPMPPTTLAYDAPWQRDGQTLEQYEARIASGEPMRPLGVMYNAT